MNTQSTTPEILDTAQCQPPALPWWRHAHVWLIISGPAIVVVAGFVTLWLAIRTPDPVVEEDYYQRGLKINETLRQQHSDRSMLPAVKGRNHAATEDDSMHQTDR
ncbi:nitrogen fixation protein FixH [Diaphorobacter sp. HDW4A]|uniref:FixH family protein n=1 Tax=Diaphorobacter sp. HDW4A TaxID=2714924 RepID=UPI00140B0625|nr:FixH family protein [Diaphorobacter sp. HDW4A]QIL79081.1 nitrogen fixation protein FixH [Diaphorobacter sp. HDW4A]